MYISKTNVAPCVTSRLPPWSGTQGWWTGGGLGSPAPSAYPTSWTQYSENILDFLDSKDNS